MCSAAKRTSHVWCAYDSDFKITSSSSTGLTLVTDSSLLVSRPCLHQNSCLYWGFLFWRRGCVFPRRLAQSKVRAWVARRPRRGVQCEERGSAVPRRVQRSRTRERKRSGTRQRWCKRYVDRQKWMWRTKNTTKHVFCLKKCLKKQNFLFLSVMWSSALFPETTQLLVCLQPIKTYSTSSVSIHI